MNVAPGWCERGWSRCLSVHPGARAVPGRLRGACGRAPAGWWPRDDASAGRWPRRARETLAGGASPDPGAGGWPLEDDQTPRRAGPRAAGGGGAATALRHRPAAEVESAGGWGSAHETAKEYLVRVKRKIRRREPARADEDRPVPPGWQRTAIWHDPQPHRPQPRPERLAADHRRREVRPGTGPGAATGWRPSLVVDRVGCDSAVFTCAVPRVSIDRRRPSGSLAFLGSRVVVWCLL